MSDIQSKDNDKSTKLSKSHFSERGRTKRGTYSEATCKNHGSVGTSSQGAHKRRKEITGHTRPSSCKEVDQTGLDGASVPRDDRKSKKRGRSELESTPGVCCLKGDDSDDSIDTVIEISEYEFKSMKPLNGDNNYGLVSPNLAYRDPDQGWPSKSSSFVQEGNDDDDTYSTYFERINEAEFKSLTQSNTMIIQKHSCSQDAEGGEDHVSEEGTSYERDTIVEGNAVTNTSIGDDANAGEEFKLTMPKSPCSKGLRTQKGVKVLQSKDQSGARIKRREKVVSPTHTKDDCDHSVDHYHGKTDAGSLDIHDHDSTKKVAETNKTEDQDKRNRGSSKQNDFCRKLADSILERGPTHENDESRVVPKQTQANQNVYSLPLKFRFEDEVPEPVQKTDSELEVESLFAQFSSACEEMNSFNYCEVEQEREKSPVGETQDARCARGQHDFQYREDAGVICIHCHHEAVGPKDVMPEWAERTRREPKRKRSSRKEDFSQFEELRFPSPVNEFAAFDSNTGTVWDIKPGMRESMYKHQQEGFEFLWMNLAGSINLVDLKSCDPSTEGGGCIISHAPGTGKSRLTIVFIENYLKLFPHCRPVIVAPAGMLLTWEEEFKKWNVDFPFINLNSSCKENMTSVGLVGSKRHKKDGIRMMKIYSWNNGGSILGISYSLFEMLTGERHIKDKMNKGRRVIIDEKIAYVRQILLEKPGLVVLDEGHTPRNHKSNIWNALLKLQTAKRVILSGTPFQNNFAELFNTLRLVRPAIADELVQEKAFSGVITSKGSSSTRFASSSESVNSVVEKLKSAISPFVHVHKGTILQESLPGLRDCVILLKPQALQKSLIEKLEGSKTTLRYEHQVALISMHPYLSKCLRPEEIQGLEIDLDAAEASKLNPNDGVKSKFILELVRL